MEKRKNGTFLLVLNNHNRQIIGDIVQRYETEYIPTKQGMVKELKGKLSIADGENAVSTLDIATHKLMVPMVISESEAPKIGDSIIINNVVDNKIEYGSTIIKADKDYLVSPHVQKVIVLPHEFTKIQKQEICYGVYTHLDKVYTESYRSVNDFKYVTNFIIALIDPKKQEVPECNDIPFVSIPVAKTLKELNFNEPCMACYDKLDMLSTYSESIFKPQNYNSSAYVHSAPLWQQSTAFLKKRGILISETFNGWNVIIKTEEWKVNSEAQTIYSETNDNISSHSNIEEAVIEGLNILKEKNEKFKLNIINSLL